MPASTAHSRKHPQAVRNPQRRWQAWLWQLVLLALVAGVTVYETTLGTTLGNLGFAEITFPKPTFHGDTIRVETEILETRLSRSRKDSGIVTFKHVAKNQRDEIVCTAVRTGLMMRKPAA